MRITMLRSLLSALLLAILAACGGGGGVAAPNPAPPGPVPAPVSGDLAIAVTDAEGDFLVYEVEVERIDLTTAAGDAVQTIPASSRIDFAELTELSELLTVASIPAGVYASVTLQLDFSDAVVLLQDESGEVREASLQDADGAPLGSVPVPLRLDPERPVRIAAGTIARLSLDFDLEASNDVLSHDPPVVEVSPFVLAMPAFDATRDLRVHGVLEEVAEDGEITIEVRPWRRRPATPGSASFTTDAETTWEIGDETFVGDAGLAALAGVAPGTALLLVGPVAERELVADRVLVGTAVPGAGSDVVTGTVLARAPNGTVDVLTLGGVRVNAVAGPDRFLRRAELLVSDQTSVRARGAGSLLDLGDAALSVGSRLVSEAVEAPTTTAAPEALPVFDATTATVLLRRSALTAEVVNGDPLVVDLVRLDGRRPGAFDFTGTAADATDDADPDAYEIATGVLDTTALEAGDVVRLRGLVADFGAAPLDFVAETLVDVATEDRGGRLTAAWREVGGTGEAISAIAPDGFIVDLSDANAALRLRGLRRDVLPEDAIVRVVPAGEGPSLFSLRDFGAGEILLFQDFAAFSDALLAGLQAGERVASLVAEGRYDRGDARLTVRRVRVQWAQ
ncbi:MAG: DUF4382 domain-containing protein [Pseudomonadales bacterium]|nr:DUF4382 domain-containing protein [Pseudomonadales bacterium]